MTARIHDNIIKGIFLTLLFIVLIIHSLVADAQKYPGLNQNHFSESTNIPFGNTEISEQTQVILGISFGAHQ